MYNSPNRAPRFQIPASLATVTTGTLHLYANGSTGSDQNDGLTSATPKKTLVAVVALIPDIVKHLCVVHLSGVFADSGAVQIQRIVNGTGLLLVDGGTDLTDLVATQASDINSSSTIGVAAAGWTTDAYMGYWVEIVSGANNTTGELRLIQGNTATTLTVCRNFSADPGAGATFRIVRPSTEISSAILYVAGQGQYAAANSTPTSPAVSIQRLYFSGTGRLYCWGSTSQMYIVGIISNASSSPSLYFSSLTGATYAYGAVINTTTGAINFGGSSGDPYLGVSQVHASSSVRVYRCLEFLYRGTARKMDVLASACFLSGGARIKGALTFDNVFQPSTDALTNSSGYAATTIDSSSGVGVTCKMSNIRIGAGVTISNNTTHGIEVDSGRVYMTGIVVGTGNGAHGCRNRRGGTVLIKDGSPPTLTGASGNLLQGGTTSAWTDVDTAPVIETLGDLCVALDDAA